MPHRRLLALCLAAALGAPAATGAQTPGLAPALDEMPADSQRLAPVVQRFRTDLGSLGRVHDTTAGPRREAALRGLYTDWQARLREIDPSGLGLKTASTTPCSDATWPTAWSNWTSNAAVIWRPHRCCPAWTP
ncbi:hypothetical protein [Arenimonas daejeonensis]|uniref:hypothetical protein n=1 Tax=Arenimonas daejeonensis TaxID=370777 RepID=UPI001D15D300|nr:hypothetical protein [Arenimonas daejeonensis]